MPGISGHALGAAERAYEPRTRAASAPGRQPPVRRRGRGGSPGAGRGHRPRCRTRNPAARGESLALWALEHTQPIPAPSSPLDHALDPGPIEGTVWRVVCGLEPTSFRKSRVWRHVLLRCYVLHMGPSTDCRPPLAQAVAATAAAAAAAVRCALLCAVRCLLFRARARAHGPPSTIHHGPWAMGHGLRAHSVWPMTGIPWPP
jgi:hypothetical protein